MNLLLYFYFYLCFSNEKHQTTNIEISSCQKCTEDDQNKTDSISRLKLLKCKRNSIFY